MAVKKTATGYQIWYYDAEGRFRKRTFKGVTRDQAVRLHREIVSKRDRGEHVLDWRQAPTFREFSSQWFQEGRPHWRPSTIVQYGNVLAKQLTPYFGEKRLSTITEGMIKERVTAWSDGGLSPRRINLILCVLKGILKTAKRRRLLTADPSVEVRLLQEPRTEVDPLSLTEIEAFRSACPRFWRPFFVVSFGTGARPGEMAALKWGDVDLKVRKTAWIRAARARGVEGPPKTARSVRELRLLPEVVDALLLQRREQSKRRLGAGEGSAQRGQDYVFTGPDGGFLNVNYVRDFVWYPTLEKAGLRRRVFYQTRHTFASNALLAGEDPNWVAQMLGHTTLEMLFRVYARYIKNRTRRDGAALAAEMLAAKASGTPNLLPVGYVGGDKSSAAAQIRKTGAEGGT